MMLIKKVRFIKEEETSFPYHLNIFNQDISFTSPITVLIGENGCGKSTLLELIKDACSLYQIGKPLNKHSQVKTDVSYTLNKPRGFYFSSEDFTTYIHELEEEKAQSRASIDEINLTYKDRSVFAKQQALSPHKKTISEINHLHERNLNESSHGEAYLAFFKSRMRSKHLILLDEPETPLSFENQLALLYIVKDSIEQGSQFIIATHSPVIMSYPGAQIIEFTDSGLKEVSYEDIKQVKMLKDFLINPNRFYNHLFKKD